MLNIEVFVRLDTKRDPTQLTGLGLMMYLINNWIDPFKVLQFRN